PLHEGRRNVRGRAGENQRRREEALGQSKKGENTGRKVSASGQERAGKETICESSNGLNEGAEGLGKIYRLAFIIQGKTVKPALAAAWASSVSPQTKTLPRGCSRHQASAAANWKESSARNPYCSGIGSASSLIFSLGRISSQAIRWASSRAMACCIP